MSTAQETTKSAASEFKVIPQLARRLEMTLPASVATLQGFQRRATSDDFPEQCQISWIRGEILIDMSPEEIFSHNQLKVEITRSIANLVRARRLGRVFADRALLTNEEAEISTEPDAMFASFASIRSGQFRWVSSDEDPTGCMSLAGTPDWVLELVSKSSVRKDTVLLRAAYQAAGVPEYWLIDARRQEMNIQIFTRTAAGYEAVSVSGGKWQSPIFAADFHLHREQGEFGFWEYTLDYV